MYFEHNIPVYNNFEPIILEHHECCIVAAMGTGKTDISIEFIKRKNLNTLVILPNTDLCNQWKKIAEMNNICTLSTITYHSFSKSFAVLASGFDCYIFDECHHMDSKVWGKSIRSFRQMIDNNKYIIGLTGDPIRYFDGCKNVADTMFHGHVVYGHSQYEAIMNGILPEVIYVCAIYDTKGLYDEYRNKATTDELRGKLSFVYENCKKINDIILNHAHDNMKGFVFVDRINAISNGINIITEAFPSAPIRSAHSYMSKRERYDNIEAFRQDANGFMVAVDIFNEGHHISGANTVIMLRKTGSPTIYAQQIGRGLSANSTETTIIYDFVSNKESMKKISERIQIITNILNREVGSIRKGKPTNTRKTSKQIIVHDYSKDFLQVLEEIDEARSKIAWTEDEDKFLRDNYNSKNGIDICVKELNRSRIACHRRARRLGLIIQKKEPWTDAEDDILRKYYPSMGQNVASKLPGRTKRACTARANNFLGLVYRTDGEWSASEIKLLKKRYQTDGNSIKLVTKSNEECLNKLAELGLLCNDGKHWTCDEDSILFEFYPSIGEECFAKITTKSIDACKSRVKRLGLKKYNREWTEDEDQIIRDKYPLLDTETIVTLLPYRTPGSIKTRASYLGVKKSYHSKSKRSWTVDEEQILIDKYNVLGKDITTLLPNKSWSSIRNKAYHMGVNRKGSKAISKPRSNSTRSNNNKQKKWTEIEDRIIIDQYPILGGKIIDLIPDRTYGAIAKRAERLGVSKYKK